MDVVFESSSQKRKNILVYDQMDDRTQTTETNSNEIEKDKTMISL